MPAPAIGIAIKPAGGGGGGYTCKVPLNSLEESGTPPEEGDKVSYSVDGTVQSISGNNAVVKIDSVNGEPVAEEASESPEEEASEEEGEKSNPGSSNPGNPGPAAAGGIPTVPGLTPRRRRTIPGLAAQGARLRKAARTAPMIL